MLPSHVVSFHGSHQHQRFTPVMNQETHKEEEEDDTGSSISQGLAVSLLYILLVLCCARRYTHTHR
ncbi:hypothetical protein E2C01_094963 [Portunus trituberculatus]|uniref:Uncharacterized protein n=1 Tax=Portunus trituberculatus TaxID=210409 RepID=A0A5B7JYL0_PORTR|nr:hypothetical protein [Portunus trituberculatus]